MGLLELSICSCTLETCLIQEFLSVFLELLKIQSFSTTAHQDNLEIILVLVSTVLQLLFFKFIC